MDGIEARKMWRKRKKSLKPTKVRRQKAVNVEDYVAEDKIALANADDPAESVIIRIRRKLVKFCTEKKER